MVFIPPVIDASEKVSNETKTLFAENAKRFWVHEDMDSDDQNSVIAYAFLVKDSSIDDTFTSNNTELIEIFSTFFDNCESNDSTAFLKTQLQSLINEQSIQPAGVKENSRPDLNSVVTLNLAKIISTNFTIQNVEDNFKQLDGAVHDDSLTIAVMSMFQMKDGTLPDSWIDKYCKEHPDHPFVNNGMIIEMAKRNVFMNGTDAIQLLMYKSSGSLKRLLFLIESELQNKANQSLDVFKVTLKKAIEDKIILEENE
uniref:Insecticidal toxin complex protein n=1 Tax=Rhabditophanes sp. KR3021 TaxID=114890 RepID=A0AC35TLP6_9BILA